MLKRTLTLAGLLILGGCAYEGTNKLPGVYRIDIQQGNVVDQDMLNQLEPGMDMQQVRYIMGTPVVIDPFHHNRWEYIYSYSEGGSQREQRHVTVYFDKNNKLKSIGGDVVAAEREPGEGALKEPSRTVEVPLRDDSKGFFGTIFGFIPFIGDEGPTPRSQPREPGATEDAETVNTESMPEN